MLGSAEDLGAVSLNDECDLHDSVCRRAVKLARDARVAEVREPAALAGDDPRPQLVVECQRAEEFGRVLEILRRERNARAAQRVRHRRGGVGEHRHVGGHCLEQRDAEAFVLAHRDVDRRVAVVDGEFFVGHRSGEHESVVEEAELVHQGADHRIIPRHHVEPSDEDEAVVCVDVALVDFSEPDDVLDLLVRRDAADEQEVHEAVVEQDVERRPLGRLRDARSVDRDREDPGAAEAERLELLPVVLRVAERDVDAPRERRQLVASQRRETEQCGVVGREVRRRRHVVVLQDAPGVERRECLGHRRRQGVVEDRHLTLRRRRIGERPHVLPEVVVDREGVEMRLVAHRPQEVADAPRAVADRVALVRRRHPLVHDHGHSQLTGNN